jgi:hypothetical protein
VPSIDLVDETFVVADPAVLAAIVADSGRWRVWWPDLELAVFMDRGRDGVRWTVTGSLVGSSEIWLQAYDDGVIVHYYLRADPTVPGSRTEARVVGDSPRARRSTDALRRRRAVAWKRIIWALKDELEVGRRPGEPRVG